LSLLFFLQHSGMVRRGMRARLDRLIPSAYYPAVYSIASGVALSMVVVFWQPFGAPLFGAQSPVRPLMHLLSLVSLAGMVWGVAALRTFDPLGLRPLRARARGQAETSLPFTVRGPYRWVRHPLYTCVIVLIWCDPLWSGDRLLFCVLWTAWIWLGAVLEERDLARKFGAAYQDYRQRVPMLIPWRRPIPPLTP
jgi:protein-S-isoprenylcysteine O-methyltransferase Ste14